MTVIQLEGLTATDAEKAIARIWYVLEQRDIESPRIDTRRDGDNRIAVRMAFQTQRDADAALGALQGLWPVVAQVPAGRLKPL